MRVLVTGGAGFIGQYVVEELEAKGHQALVFDRRKDRPIPPEHFFLGDVMDEVAVTEAMAHVDGFIHLAACLGTQETIKDPRPSALTNIVGGLNMLQAAALYDRPGVYIGVGNHWMQNSYSISKTTVERYVHMFNQYRGTRVNIVRPVNAYGPRQSAAPPFGSHVVRKITPAFVCRALSGMPIEVYGDGTQVSDMVYVGDVARVLVTMLEHAGRGEVHPFAVECGPEIPATVNEVAALVAEFALQVRPSSRGLVQIAHLPMRPGEIPNATVSADVATMREVGINPDTFTSLQAGMRKTVEWFHANEGTAWHRPKGCGWCADGCNGHGRCSVITGA